MTDNYTFAPCSKKQALMLEDRATLTILGGAAGSGKSYTLLLDPLKHISDPNYHAIIFRRTNVQLKGQGGLWQTCRAMYQQIPHPNKPIFKEQGMTVVFPSGATIKFSHLEHLKNIYDHQGLQYSAVYFDEGTHYPFEMIDYLMSRLRSAAKVDAYMKISCNPDPQSWIREFIEKDYLDVDGYPRLDQDGVVMWYVRQGGDLVWGSTEKELLSQFPDLIPTSFCWVSATIEDNPILMEQEPAYKARLLALNPIDKARLLYGNWFVEPEGQSYMDRKFFKKADKVPTKAVACRAWDKAASEFNPDGDSNRFCDYTASTKMYKDHVGDIYVTGEYHESNRDHHSGILGKFRSRAGPRDIQIENQALMDGPEVVQILPKDPSAAGLYEFQESCKKLNAIGIRTKEDPAPSRASKLTKVLPFCAALECGNVYIVESTFEKASLTAFYKELEGFDGERSNGRAGKHDDVVDTLASNYAYLAKTKLHKIIPRNQIPSTSISKELVENKLKY